MQLPSAKKREKRYRNAADALVVVCVYQQKLRINSSSTNISNLSPEILIEQSNLAQDRHSVCFGWVGWEGE